MLWLSLALLLWPENTFQQRFQRKGTNQLLQMCCDPLFQPRKRLNIFPTGSFAAGQKHQEEPEEKHPNLRVVRLPANYIEDLKGGGDGAVSGTVHFCNVQEKHALKCCTQTFLLFDLKCEEMLSLRRFIRFQSALSCSRISSLHVGNRKCDESNLYRRLLQPGRCLCAEGPSGSTHSCSHPSLYTNTSCHTSARRSSSRRSS